MSDADSQRGSPPHIAAQLAAAWTAFDKTVRDEALAATLDARDRAFAEASAAMEHVKDFVGSPENILGSTETKHGEIAEECHVGFRRAIDFLYDRTPMATFEGVDRTGPVDYIDGVDIQSKFYNGLRNTLAGVEDHAERYSEFVTSGARYHIPKDQYEQLLQLRETGAVDGLSERSVEPLQALVESMEQRTGRSFDDLVAPSEVSYAEVQQGRVHETINSREDDLAARDDELRRQAQGGHGPSLSGAVTAVGMGGVAGAGVGFAQAVWLKYRAEGKNPFQGDFAAADWQDVGLKAAKGGADGALAGGSVYLLTNATDLAAPFAGSLVSGLMGIGDLIGQYQNGQIDGEDFVDLSLMVTSESAIVGIAAAAGQTLIPVPMLGAFIGSVAGKFVALAVRDCLEGDSELVALLEEYAAQSIARLDESLRQAIEELDAYCARLADLTRLAFDEGVNVELRLHASIEVAEVLGVPDEDIVRTQADLDSFMLRSS
ncbi:MAG: hypothetical protein OXH15_00355 [Gammaproteobacteria bacterium]|nr:hypothetical protein [Gammaproteobacteria bacterium]